MELESFQINDNFGYTVTEGDAVSIRGAIGQYNGLTQTYAVGVTLNSQNNDLLDARVVAALNEDTESNLVTLENVTLVDPTKWKESGNGFNVDVTDGLNTYTLRVDNDVVVDKPEGVFNVTGLGGQYDSDSPYDSDYQLFPRYNSDISIVESTDQVDGVSFIEFSPNPVTDFITVITELEIGFIYSVYD